MTIALYIVALVAGAGLVTAACRHWGYRPTPLRIALGLGGGLLVTAAWLMLTVILSREGRSSRIPLLLWLGVWAILATVRPAGKAVLLSGLLFAYSIVLAFPHMHLANSPEFTDNPRGRHSSVLAMRRSAERSGQALPPAIRIGSTWHTWLTGLHVVE